MKHICTIRTKVTLAVTLLLLTDLGLSQLAPEAQRPAPIMPANAVDVRPSQLRPAFFVWKIGVNRDNPNLAIENIFPTEANGRRVWRVLHNSADPTRPNFGYDYYDVDPITLRPIISEMKYPEPERRYRIEFGTNQASLRRTERGETSEEVINVPTHLYPEGPGYSAFLAALPLRERYSVSYASLNRWNKQKLDVHTLRVIKREAVSVPAGRFNTFVVEDEAPSGVYIKVWVLDKPPHYAVRTEYMRAPRMWVSELQEFTIGK